jgi:hypothetical protein
MALFAVITAADFKKGNGNNTMFAMVSSCPK